jgi:undecaprenyl-diphosphatase
MIKDHLESTYIMGAALILGGVVMYAVDQLFGEKGHPLTPGDPKESQPPVAHGKIDTIHGMKIWQAVWIGAVQILSAIFPGTSRSMSSIAAGQVAGLTRTTALEFSFYLSIPIMFMACGKDLLDSLNPKKEDYIGHPLSPAELSYLAIGSVVSFITALAVIALFMAWVRRRGFTPFAIYRVLIGIAVLIWAGRGG